MTSKCLKLFVLGLLVSLAACGGSSSNEVAADSATGTTGGGAATGGEETSNPDNPASAGGDVVTSNLKYYGVINFTDRPTNEISISGGFGRFTVDIPEQAALDQLDPVDSCVVSRSNTSGGPVSFEVPDFSNSGSVFSLVSAGDVIPFSGASGPFADLKKMVNFGFTTYGLDSNASGPAPAALSFSIPGDVYPAFPNVAVPDVPPVVWISPTSSGFITADSTLTWQASGDPDAVIKLFAVSISLSDPLAGATYLRCTMADDGSFEFSAATKAELGGDFSAPGRASISRQVTRLTQNGNALLAVIRENESQ